MNFNAYLQIADSIIQQSMKQPKAKTPKKKPGRDNIFQFSDVTEHEFWEMGSDDLAKLQDEDDIGYQVARHSH